MPSRVNSKPFPYTKRVASVAAAFLILAAATTTSGSTSSSATSYIVQTAEAFSSVEPLAHGIAGLDAFMGSNNIQGKNINRNTRRHNKKKKAKRQQAGATQVSSADESDAEGSSAVEEAVASLNGKSLKDIKVKNQNHTVKAKKLAKSTMKLMMEKEVGFLEAKRKEKGVRRLPNGLLFKIVKKGKGSISPNHDDPCELRYTAFLMDGKAFDNSASPKAAVSPSQCSGWAEALQLMREGDEWEVYLPHHLAFGADGVEGIVPEYTAVTYRIELVKVAGGGKEADDNEAVFLRHFGREYAEL